MSEVFDPGYRIRVGGLPAGWSELDRKAPELSRDDYLGKLHADMDIARTIHYACGSRFNLRGLRHFSSSRNTVVLAAFQSPAKLLIL